jgi:valyl-tRNA synthetase
VGRKPLTRNFDYKSEEPRLYAHWENNGFFKPSTDPKAPAFCIPMPPPNITGELHMGHALFTTLQDTIIRHKRAQGYSALWLPGTDHAGLATHEKIMALLKKKRLEPSRANYEQEAEGWKAKTGNRISEQIRRLGASCDWSRERYTLDDGYTRAVHEAYARLQAQGLISKRDGQIYFDTSALAADLLARYQAGEIKIIPEHEGKTFAHFLENIEPWCISRQIWWGHQIPGEDDVFDTWFSSALWPFAIHGWPEQTPDLERYYPADLIETGADILFFWCARMMMMGLALTDRLPFKTIYLHGMIRDAQGRKMSKSLGNGIDPLDIIQRYSCDGMRFALLENCTEGQDINLGDDMFDAGKRFCNKLWQASRFALGHWERQGCSVIGSSVSEHPDDLTILTECHEASRAISEALNGYEFRQAAYTFRHFFKDRFCDWYIEAAKDRLYADDKAGIETIMSVLQSSLKMAHPMIPFITSRIEEAFRRLT